MEEGGCEEDVGTFSVSIAVKDSISEVSEMLLTSYHDCALEMEYLSKSLNRIVSWEEWKSLITLVENNNFSAEYFQHTYLFLLHNLNLLHYKEIISGYEALSKHLEEVNDLTPFEESLLTNILQIPYIWILVVFSFKKLEQESNFKQLELFFSTLNRNLKKPKQNNSIHVNDNNNNNNNNNITLFHVKSHENDIQKKEGKMKRVILEKKDMRLITASVASLSLYMSSNSSNFNKIRELMNTLDKINAKRPLGIYWTYWYKRQYVDTPLEGLDVNGLLSIPVEEEGIFDFSKLLYCEEKPLCERGIKCPTNVELFSAFVNNILRVEIENSELNIEKSGLVARYVKLMQQSIDLSIENASPFCVFQLLVNFFIVFCTIHPPLLFEKLNHLLRIIQGELIKFSSEDLSDIERSFINHYQIILLIYFGLLQSTHLSIEPQYHINYDENDHFILENTTPLDISNLHDFEKIHTYQYYYRDHRTLDDYKVISDYIKTLEINLHLLNKLSGTKVTSIDDIFNGPVQKLIKMNEEIYFSQPNNELVESLILFYYIEKIAIYLDDYILKLNEEESMSLILEYYIEVLRDCSINKENDLYIQILPKIDKIMNDFPDLIKKKTKYDVLHLLTNIFAIHDQIDECKKHHQKLKEIYTETKQRCNYIRIYTNIFPIILKDLSPNQILDDIDSTLLSPLVGLNDPNSFDNLLVFKGEELEALEDKYFTNRDIIIIYHNLYLRRSEYLQQMGDIIGAFKSIVLCVKFLSIQEKDTINLLETVCDLINFTFKIFESGRCMTFDSHDLLHYLHFCIEYFSSYFDRNMQTMGDYRTNLPAYFQFIKILLRIKEYEKAMKCLDRIIGGRVFEFYDDYWTANRLYVEACLGLNQYEKAKEFTNQVKTSNLAEINQIITLERRIQLKELQQIEKWTPNINQFYIKEFIDIANTLLVLHQRNNLPPIENSLRESRGITIHDNDNDNDYSNNYDNNFFSLLPIEIIYQIIEYLADFPKYHLLSSPITRNANISLKPIKINDSPLSSFYSKILDLVYLMPAEYWEANFDIFDLSMLNSRMVTVPLSFYISQLPEQLSYDEGEQGYPIYDYDQWFVASPASFAHYLNVNLRRDQIILREIEINDQNFGNAEYNYYDSSVLRLRMVLFDLCRIPPSFRTADHFNQIFEFLFKRKKEFLIVLPNNSSYLVGCVSVDTSFGTLDIRYHIKQFISNCNHFINQFEEFICQLIEKSEVKSKMKSNSPIKFEKKILKAIEEIPRMTYEEIERFFNGDKKDATKEEFRNCLLSILKETFPCDNDCYRNVEIIFKKTLKIMELNEKNEGVLNRKENNINYIEGSKRNINIEILENFMEDFSHALFEEFRNNFKKSDYLPTFLFNNYFPITTLLESIYNNHTKEEYMGIFHSSGISPLAYQFIEDYNSFNGTNFEWINEKIDLEGNGTLSYHYSTLQFESQLVDLTPLNPVRKFECYIEGVTGSQFISDIFSAKIVLKENGVLYLKATIIDLYYLDVTQMENYFQLLNNVCYEAIRSRQKFNLIIEALDDMNVDDFLFEFQPINTN